MYTRGEEQVGMRVEKCPEKMQGKDTDSTRNTETEPEPETEPAIGMEIEPENRIPVEIFLKYVDRGVSLLEIGPEIKVLYMNKRFREMFGLDRGPAALPCGLDEIGIHPDYIQEYEDILRSVESEERVVSHIQRIAGNNPGRRWRKVRAVRIPYQESGYPVMLELSENISERVKRERDLRESKEMLQVAFRQTSNMLWEVDLQARTFSIYNVDEQRCEQNKTIADFPRSFLENGMVHPDSASEFLEFADRILKGKEGGRGNFIIRDGRNRCYSWVTLSYRMIFDREGNPVKAVGVQVKLPDIWGAGSNIFSRRPLPETMRHHLLFRMKANITADYLDEIWIQGTDQTARTWGKHYSEIVQRGLERFFTESDVIGFRSRFKRDNLLKAFERRELWSSREYKWIDDGGNIRWMEDTVNLVQDPKDGAVRMFVCCNDTQQRHEWENKAGGESKRDAESGLYDPGTMKRITEALIGEETYRTCTMSMIRSLGEICPNKTEEAEKIQGWIATAMVMALGTDCIACRYTADTLLVFFPAGGAKLDIKRRIEDAFTYVRTAMSGDGRLDRLRFVAGTVTEATGETSYDVLLYRTGYLCEMWECSAMDVVAFPSEDEDWAWAGLRKGSKEDGVMIYQQELERALTKEEQGIAFSCVTDMLKASSLEDSMLNALRCIGRYYRAARTYILLLSEDGQTVSMPYEWTGSGRRSIRYVVAGVRVDQIPLLERCMEEKSPLLVDTPSQMSAQGTEDMRWCFTVFPMKNKTEIKGFLCVENAQEHKRDAALLGTLLPYIQGENRRFESIANREQTTGRDTLTSLPNLSSYMDVVCSLDSDTYSSMGALSLDIPKFSAINSRFSFEYGRKMLLYIADALVSIFGKAFIFRTWDAEFVVLFPNTIQEVFNGRCTRLRTMLQRRYPRQIRFGAVWAKNVFSARNMVREAKAIMHCEMPGESSDSHAEMIDEIRQSGSRKLDQNSFVPYFQPKVDMRDGALVGAEALVRGIDKEGNIIPPQRFIGELEKDGSIRELDLLMLENVLRQLSEWKKRGLELCKVSVNISRVTLFNSSALASVLAIQSRYPDIAPELIELEITETAGDMEKASLAYIVDSFRECGVQFELDDFGAGYANLSIFGSIKFSTVKLDRSLVNDLPGNEISSMLVEKITQVCRNFDIQCVAEGVETVQQEETLLKAGCLYGQGYYYARPMSAYDFEMRYMRVQTKG